MKKEVKQVKAPAGRKSGSSSKSSSGKAGLIFPVARIARQLREKRLCKRVSPQAAVYLGGVLEYLVAEILEVSGNVARESGRTRIAPRHVQLAIGNDEELVELLKGVTLPGCGVMPSIHEALLPASKGAASKKRLETGKTEKGGQSTVIGKKTEKGGQSTVIGKKPAAARSFLGEASQAY